MAANSVIVPEYGVGPYASQSTMNSWNTVIDVALGEFYRYVKVEVDVECAVFGRDEGCAWDCG